MNPVLALECQGDIGICRPSGTVHLSDAVGLVTEAIVEARRQRLTGLLFVISGLTGFRSPGIAARHAMVREWANAAEGALRLAMVMPSEFIDPEAFGAVAARNFGLVGGGFVTEAEAMAWLQEGH